MFPPPEILTTKYLAILYSSLRLCTVGFLLDETKIMLNTSIPGEKKRLDMAAKTFI
jgi:hypothetical protein